MKKAEVIIEYGMYGREVLKFRRWLIGWLYDRYGVCVKGAEGDDLIVFEVDGDMFELFSDLRIEAKLVLRDMRADVKAFGVCSGDECIVVDDFRVDVVLSDHDLRKLERVVRRIGRMVDYRGVSDVKIVNQGGMIIVYMGSCCARLYINEAFVMGVNLVKFVEDISMLQVSKGVDVVYDLFELPEPRSLDIDFITDEDGVILSVGRCSRHLKIGEALRVAYGLMRLSLNELLLRRDIEKWGL
ncbi:MAG: hypothetical protein ACO2O1_06685 [Candidatus Caldarchaeales archaeon]|jgi:hypothetical protein